MVVINYCYSNAFVFFSFMRIPTNIHTDSFLLHATGSSQLDRPAFACYHDQTLCTRIALVCISNIQCSVLWWCYRSKPTKSNEMKPMKCMCMQIEKRLPQLVGAVIFNKYLQPHSLTGSYAIDAVFLLQLNCYLLALFGWGYIHIDPLTICVFIQSGA